MSFCKVCGADDLKPWLYGLTEKLLLLIKVCVLFFKFIESST